jgi:hypothetical protein
MAIAYSRPIAVFMNRASVIPAITRPPSNQADDVVELAFAAVSPRALTANVSSKTTSEADFWLVSDSSDIRKEPSSGPANVRTGTTAIAGLV